MATTTTNGGGAAAPYEHLVQPQSSVLEVPLNQGDESLELDFDDIIDSGDAANLLEVIAETFINERLGAKYWTRAVSEYWKRGKRELAQQLAERGIRALKEQGNPEAAVPLLCQLANFNLVLARSAPTTKLEEPRQDRLGPELLLRQQYIDRASARFNEAAGLEQQHPLVLDARAFLCVSQKGKEKEATQAIDQILSKQPHHLPAQILRARLLLRASPSQPRQALKIFQNVLSMAPRSLPDPRIGIGSCLWSLGDKARARQAWQRSIVVHPNEHSLNARLLLGLSHLSASKDPSLPEDARLKELQNAIQHLQTVFKASPSVAGAAAGLTTYFLKVGQWSKAIKFAERALQYADIPPLQAEGHLALARALHAQGDLEAAQKEYSLAASAQGESAAATYPILGASQIFVAQGNYTYAINALENIFRRDPQCIEALANLAAVRAHLAFTTRARPDAEEERVKAAELYDRITRMFSDRVRRPGATTSEGDDLVVPQRIAEVMRDPDLYIDVARLAGENDVNRALKGYRESLVARESTGKPIPPMLLNNLGVLEWRKGDLLSAQEKIQRALTEATGSAKPDGGDGEPVVEELDPLVKERVTVSMLFNLGAISEDLGQIEQAKQIYERLLSQHPEYVDAKARLALMALKTRDFAGSDALLKEALESRPDSVDLRALYTYFLVESGQIKVARDFAMVTLGKHDSKDVYTLCAAAALYYTQARENKTSGPEAAQDRNAKFLRSCETFERALSLDVHCTFAAQGLAIALAENVLAGAGSGSTPADAQARIKNARDALTILTKVRESLNDPSVYVNLGHCHYARDEYERAIENYGTASKRFHQDKNAQILLYLARAWYQKATRDSSFTGLRQALNYATSAQALAPADLAIAFNVALIQQKGLELLLGLAYERRSLADIKIAAEEAETAQQSFGELAEDKGGPAPFDRDTAHQRRRYGESLLRRVAEALQQQEAYESTEAAKIERARQEREAERQRLADAERRRMEETRQRNEELARKRQEMLETTATWYVKTNDDDEEGDGKATRGRKAGGKRKVKVVEGIEDIDEGVAEVSEEEVERPRKKRPKKDKSRDASKDVSAQQSGVDQDDDDDDEDDGPVVRKRKPAPGKPGKQFKSAEFVDSDEEN